MRCFPCCTSFLINSFEIEMVLCDLYLKRFGLTKDLLFDNFSILFGTNYVFMCLSILMFLTPLAEVTP